MSDDPQFLMNTAKKVVVLDYLIAHDNKATFGELFDQAEKHHCDVLAAVLMSLKRKRVISFPGMLLLMPGDKDVEVVLENPEYDCFA